VKIVTVVGARPQFVKAAMVSRALATREDMREVMIHTGQHYDERMSDVFFQELEIPTPAHHLGIGSGSHGAQTGRMLEAIEGALQVEKPDAVMVYGDTNSTLAGALAAVKLQVPVVHVEAGLRSFNRAMPEEINRVLTDHAADLLFVPTDAALEHLKREGLPEARIRCVGDVMFDAALRYAKRARERSAILEQLGLTPGGYILVTVHRAENTNNSVRLDMILQAIEGVAQHVPVVWPVHPRVQACFSASSNLTLIEPVGYLDMVMLEMCARTIATDSGGVQKEAYFHRVPCVTLRNETEWSELVNLGWNRLVNVLEPEAVCKTILEMPKMTHHLEYNEALYGNGRASERIAQELISFLNLRKPA
jgi:UDP-GlcNAc3NAcA epimerase